jgi:maleate isomerase
LPLSFPLATVAPVSIARKKVLFMPDRYGPRGVMALFIPLQNSNMQPEYEAMRPDGVSNQIYRIDLSVADRVPEAAIRSVGGGLGCWPDVVVVGNSVEMRLLTAPEFGNYRAALHEKIGDIPLVTAADATIAALKKVGAKRVAMISPMSNDYSQSAADFYEAFGFDVPYHCGLQVGLPQNIIKLGYKEARDAFRRLDHGDVDTFLHVGAALGIADSIERLETELGRPVVSVNVATYWRALRTIGVNDPLKGFGRLAAAMG